MTREIKPMLLHALRAQAEEILSLGGPFPWVPKSILRGGYKQKQEQTNQVVKVGGTGVDNPRRGSLSAFPAEVFFASFDL